MLRARTLAEANLYANLSLLLTGEGEAVAPDEPEEGPEGWTVRYGQVEIFVPYASEAEARRSGARFGPGVSELIDAGQWKLISAEYAHQTLRQDMAYSVARADDEEAYQAIVTGWRLAMDAAGEVLKFIPPGADRVPDEAFWTEMGAAARAEEPERFTREVLERDIEMYQNYLDEFHEKNP